MEYFIKIRKESTVEFNLITIFKKLILISFLSISSALFAQNADLVFNDLGKGTTHKYWEKYSPNQQLSSKHVLDQLQKDNVLSPEDSLGLISAKTSHHVAHNHFQQFHNGLPIEGAYFSTHSINGVLIAFNGTLISSLQSYNTNTVITSPTAIEMAKTNIDATKYAWEDDAYIALLQSANEDEHFSIFPRPILTLYQAKGDKYVLAYKMEIHAIEPQGRFTIYIDANTGNLLDKFDNLQHANSSSTCATLHHGSQNIDFDLNGANYELTDKLGPSNRNMETYLLPNNSIIYANATVPFMSASSPVADCFNLTSNFDQAALDIHWATGVVYDYFNALGINSFDNNGALIKSYTNYGNSSNSNNNAFWNGNFFTYGAGGGGTFPSPVVTLDVAAHEFGHAITEAYGGGLLYQGESGAINESISDMIAASVEHFTIANNSIYANGLFYSIPNEWIISKLNGGGIRDMSNPNLYGHPNTYLGTDWASTNGLDNGGVHTNSGVGNYWFYLLANPLGSNGNQVNDNGTLYSVNSIGFDDALAIVLESYNYLTFTSNYLDFRNATITAAEVLFNDWRVCEVIAAWDAVGVGVLGESCALQAGIAYTQTQYCTAQAMSFSSLFGQSSANTYTWTLNGFTTLGYDLNINAPSTPGVYTLIQTVTNNISGDYVTAEIDLYINNCTPINASAHNGIWYFGDQQGFDFSNGIAQITSYPYQVFEKNTSFSLGNDLKFYISSGLTGSTLQLYDNAHNLIANLPPLEGSGVFLGSSAPDANNEYINVFLNSSHQGGAGNRGLYRLTVRIDGSGNVIYDNFTPVIGPAYASVDGNGAIRTREGTGIVPGCNSSVYWIIAPLAFSGNRVLVYKLDYSNTSTAFTNYGDLTLVHEYTNSIPTANVNAISPDGRFVVIGNSIFEFDRSTGALSNFANLGLGTFGCFSSNSRYYYNSNSSDANIDQYDLYDSDVLLSKTLVTTLSTSAVLNDLELGPDGKIYVSISGKGKGVINNPNVKEVNGSTLFNPFGYYLPHSSLYFSDFTEALAVYDEPLSISYVQENCHTFKFIAPLCKPYYSWDFGDGTLLTNSNQDEVIHTYTGTGPYTVSLTSMINGTLSTETETIVLQDEPLSISYSQESCNTFTFTAPECKPYYSWDFGDGTMLPNSNQEEVTHSFTGTGPYTVSLTSLVNSVVATETIVLQEEPLSLSYAQENCNTFTFIAPTCKPYYTWDFGDGTILTNSNQNEVIHAYTGTGPYMVSLTSIVNGVLTTEMEIIDFGIDINSLAITGSSTTCEVNNYFSGPAGFEYYDWSIVSGAATVNNPTSNQITVTNSGNNFTIQLIITDFSGCTATLTKSVVVGNNPNINIVSLNSTTTLGCDGQLVFDITGGLAPYDYFVHNSHSGTSNNQVSISDLCVDSYNIFVTDVNGCEGFKHIPAKDSTFVNFISASSIGNENNLDGNLLSPKDCLSYTDYTVEIALSKKPGVPVDVIFSINAASTATLNVDFDIMESSPLIIGANEQYKTLTVRVYDDANVESPETIVLDLTSANLPLVDGIIVQHTLTINDNELDINAITNVNFFTEDFGGGLPATWSLIDNSGGGNWTYNNSFWFNSTTSGNGYMNFDSDAYGWDNLPEDADLQLPILDCSNYNNVSLNFEQYFEQFFNSTTTIEVSNDGVNFTSFPVGNNASLLQFNGTANPELINIDIGSVADGQPTVFIKFKYTGDYDLYWRIDDVNVSYGLGREVETVLSESDEQYLGPNEIVNFYGSDGDVMATIQNGSYDYGCTTVELVRTGNATHPFWNNNIANEVMSKVIRITPTNNTPSASETYDLTVFYNQAEMDIWTNNTSGLITDMQLIKVSGATFDQITPNDNTYYGNVSALGTTDASFGTSNYQLTATSSGFSDFLAGILESGGLLPIELLDFTAQINDDKSVSLFWETLTEINNDYFTVERSKDGITWGFVTAVDGAGNSNQPIKYNTIDYEPVNGLVYYRLKQTDFDLNYSYSNVVAFNYQGRTDKGIEVFPNPTQASFTIKLASDLTDVNVTIVNILGQIIYQSNIVSNITQVETANWSNGVYTIYLKDENNEFIGVKKLIVAK